MDISQRKAKVNKMLTREELKAVHNNIITIMENRVMQMTGCNRQTANLVANEVLDLDRDADMLLNEKSKLNVCFFRLERQVLKMVYVTMQLKH